MISCIFSAMFNFYDNTNELIITLPSWPPILILIFIGEATSLISNFNVPEESWLEAVNEPAINDNDGPDVNDV